MDEGTDRGHPASKGKGHFLPSGMPSSRFPSSGEHNLGGLHDKITKGTWAPEASLPTFILGGMGQPVTRHSGSIIFVLLMPITGCHTSGHSRYFPGEKTVETWNRRSLLFRITALFNLLLIITLESTCS